MDSGVTARIRLYLIIKLKKMKIIKQLDVSGMVKTEQMEAEEKLQRSDKLIFCISKDFSE